MTAAAVAPDTRLRSVDERNAMVEKFMPLATRIADRLYQRADVRRMGTFEDVLQECYLSLIRAAEKFDPEFGVAQITYLFHWIWGRGRANARQGSADLRSDRYCRVFGLVRVPTSHKITREHHQDPEDAKWQERIRQAIAAMNCQQFPVDDKGEELDPTTWTDPDPFAQEALRAILRPLTQRERGILIRRYNLDGQGAATLEEIGQDQGVSKERIRQIEKRALTRVRRHADAKLAAA